MIDLLNVLVIGRTSEGVGKIAATLDNQHKISVTTHVQADNRAPPLAGEKEPPGALLLAVEDDWQVNLRELVNSLPPAHPPFFVISPQNDMNLLRAAMRAGARDVFAMPFKPEELISAVAQVAEEERLRTGKTRNKLYAFMNAKGGSGASFLATNLAVILARTKERKTLLVDLDFQFGSLPTYLNMPVRNGLIKALELVDTLDQLSMQGYTQAHDSGLDVLAAAMDDIILPEDVSEARITELLEVLQGIYRNIVVDLPHRIDAANAAVLLRADRIVLVAQQTITHLHDTKRLIALLQEQLGIPGDRLLLVLNRASKKDEVRLADFSKVLPGLTVVKVPGDYRHVAESINLGVPLSQSAKFSGLARCLDDLATTISTPYAQETPKKKGLFGWFGRHK